MSFRNFIFGLPLAFTLIFNVSAAELASVPATAHFKKIMIVILENTNYADARRQPFLSSMVNRGALLDNMSAETHPSQANYIALVSGSTQGVTGDGNVTVNARHIGDLLEAKNLNWKVYAENFPGGCFLGSQSGRYVRKHVPFLSFKSVQSIPANCAKIVEASAMNTDIQNGTLPEFSLYVPNLDNDAHDTGVAFADKWLSKVFGPLMTNAQFMKDMLLVVTFDENAGQSGNQIFTALYGNNVTVGSVVHTPLTHYSLLRMIEDEFALGNLGKNDATSSGISGVWQ